MSYGAAAAGAAPYGGQGVDFGRPAGVAATLASDALTYLVEIDLSVAGFAEPPAGFGPVAYGAAAYGAAESLFVAPDATTAVLRFADRPFISRPDDDPPAAWYEPRLVQPLRLTRGLQLAPGIPADGGQTATVELENGDGGLDNTVAAAAIDGRPLRVLAGPADGALADFEPVWTGVARAWQPADDRLAIEGYDASYLLDTPVQTVRYAGSGGVEGAGDLAGTPKPLAFGAVFNVEPVAVDPAALVFQVHDGPVRSIAVHEGGLALAAGGDVADLYAGSTAAGQFRTDLARGLFQLGASPSLRITCDVEGDAPAAGGYSAAIGTILRRLLTARAGLAAWRLDAGSFDSLDAAGIGTCGAIVDGEESARSVLNRLLARVGGFWTCRRDGRIRVLRLAEPAPEAVLRRFDATAILSLRPLRQPDATFPPVERVVVGWRRNHTVQAGADLAGAVTDGRRQELGRSWRTAQQFDGGVAGRHLAAGRLGPVECPLQAEADAAGLAAFLLGLHAADRLLLEVVVPAVGQAIEMGETVLIAWPRLGLGAGRAFRAFPVDEDCAAGTVTLVCWG